VIIIKKHTEEETEIISLGLHTEMKPIARFEFVFCDIPWESNSEFECIWLILIDFMDLRKFTLIFIYELHPEID
jgi:hypothetical protein